MKDVETISSHTLSTESIMSILTIDATENKYVVIFDVPGAYLHA